MAKTVILNIRNSAFPAAAVRPGTYVVWRNLDPFPHSAETERSSDFYFNAGALLPGEVSSPVLFADPGRFDYRCRYHAGMAATIEVRADAPESGSISEGDQGHAGEHDHGGGGHMGGFNHLHGFVTGGRNPGRLFMTHTPVLADPRHCYQVILRGSLQDPKHADAYSTLRGGSYGDRRVQILHEHTSLPGIASGEITVLPECSFIYYPDIKHPDDQADVPGLAEKVPVRIDKVLHFHKFDVDADDGDGSLQYLVYGDMTDVFMDHLMNRAPSFHSVAKLNSIPPFWTEAAAEQGTVALRVPGKKVLQLQPKVLQRIAFVDNSFHIFWLPPTGVHTPPPLDPLFPRNAFDPDDPATFKGGPFRYDVLLADGTASHVELGRALHFDLRLLNYGVFLPDNA